MRHDPNDLRSQIHFPILPKKCTQIQISPDNLEEDFHVKKAFQPFFLRFICSEVDITGSFIVSSDEDDEMHGGDPEVQSVDEDDGVPTDPNMGSSSFHILDGSVILTPNKGFESDTDSSSGSESDSTSNSDLEIAYDDDTKYVQLCTLYSYFELEIFFSY